MSLVRFRRVSAGNIGPKRYHRNLAVSWLTPIPLRHPRMVHLFNNRCLLKQMGNIPSAEAEANFYAALKQGALAA